MHLLKFVALLLLLVLRKVLTRLWFHYFIFSRGRGSVPVMKTAGRRQIPSHTEPHHVIMYHTADSALQQTLHQPPAHLPPYELRRSSPQVPHLAPPTKRPRTYNWPS